MFEVEGKVLVKVVAGANGVPPLERWFLDYFLISIRRIWPWLLGFLFSLGNQVVVLVFHFIVLHLVGARSLNKNLRDFVSLG